jgi:hypothetical protein
MHLRSNKMSSISCRQSQHSPMSWLMASSSMALPQVLGLVIVVAVAPCITLVLLCGNACTAWFPDSTWSQSARTDILQQGGVAAGRTIRPIRTARSSGRSALITRNDALIAAHARQVKVYIYDLAGQGFQPDMHLTDADSPACSKCLPVVPFASDYSESWPTDPCNGCAAQQACGMWLCMYHCMCATGNQLDTALEALLACRYFGRVHRMQMAAAFQGNLFANHAFGMNSVGAAHSRLFNSSRRCDPAQAMS